jgi:hypothetical protein
MKNHVMGAAQIKETQIVYRPTIQVGDRKRTI